MHSLPSRQLALAQSLVTHPDLFLLHILPHFLVSFAPTTPLLPQAQPLQLSLPVLHEQTSRVRPLLPLRRALDAPVQGR